MVHVHDHEAETLAHLGREDQARGVRHVGKGKVERQVEGAWIGLVGGEKQERLVGAFVEFHLRHRRPHAAHVAGKGILEQILPGPWVCGMRMAMSSPVWLM